MRDVLLVGGAPRVAVDAVRYLTVAASGATAVALRRRLLGIASRVELLLAQDAMPSEAATRYATRDDLEAGLARWIAAHRDGVVVMSAAVNDYALASLETMRGGVPTPVAPGGKAPSGADELVIRLRPASKVIDRLRAWGLTGPIVGFKYEHRDTVLAAAAALRARVAAELVVANSLCGTLQATIDAGGIQRHADRDALLDALAGRLAALAV